jgi:hypothetical protein
MTVEPIRALQRCRSMAKRRRITLAEDPDSTKPELRIPNAAAQTRIVSVARSRLDSRKSVRRAWVHPIADLPSLKRIGISHSE